MNLAYMPFFVDDYEADTAHLSLLEDGAYNRLLRLIWRTSGCSVPDDDAWIFRKLRAHQDAEKEAILNVIDEFFTRANGRVLSKRLTKVRAQSVATYKKRSEAGKKGGRKKVPEIIEEDIKPGLSDDKAELKQPKPKPKPNIAKAIAWPERSEILKELSAECGEGIEDPNTSASMMMSIGSVLAWQAAGYDWRMVKSVVAEKTKHPKVKKISSWSWFQKAMSEAHETWIPPAEPKEVDEDTRRVAVEYKIKTGNWLPSWGSPPTIEEERKVRELLSKRKDEK